MLKRYEIQNFKSFKNRTVINLEKTNYHTLSQTNISGKTLKGLLFVGANASGKSNSIIAIKFLLDSLLGVQDINMADYFCIFSQEPTMELSYTFDIDGSNIEYTFKYQRVDKILRETLSVDGKELFSRDGSVAKVSISEETTHSDVPADSLFLRNVYFNTRFKGNKALQDWFEFLSNSVYIDLYSRKAHQYSAVDLSLPKYLKANGTKKINDFFAMHCFNQSIEYNKKSVGTNVSFESSDNMIYFKRKDIGEPIPFVFESLGNQILLQMLPAFFHCIENSGMLLIDEFSSGFHNDLEELLVKYFMENARNSQMIFVSHSTNLLTNRLLRPDQIYSVDFDSEGSRIKRFSSEKPREAQNLEKMYLSGIFDGVPGYEN